MVNEKHTAALNSVYAAVFLTVMKIVVGIVTGSLGIISEAAHSALDLGAAVITLFAVNYSAKPADVEHHYGHGKIESFSALIETVLLLVTCGWIIYEAVEKLFFHKGREIIGSEWGIATMVISIIINYSRVIVLRRVAKKHGSQALEADALHFSSDVWSSFVVILGLIFVWAGAYFKIPVFKYGDPIAAFGVSLLVIQVSIKLGKETINVLLDTAPAGMRETILNEVSNINDVLEIADIRVRPSGPVHFIDISVGIDRNASHKAVHSIVREIREKIREQIPRSDIIISTFPVDIVGVSDEGIYQAIKTIVDQFPNCINIHNIHVYDVGDKKKIAAHIELKDNLTLKESHDLSHRISNIIQDELPDIDSAVIYFQCSDQKIMAEDITESRQDLIEDIRKRVKKIKDDMDCHDIKLYLQNKKISVFLHCAMNENYTVEKLEDLSRNITEELKNNIKHLDDIHIHFEPKGVEE